VRIPKNNGAGVPAQKHSDTGFGEVASKQRQYRQGEHNVAQAVSSNHKDSLQLLWQPSLAPFHKFTTNILGRPNNCNATGDDPGLSSCSFLPLQSRTCEIPLSLLELHDQLLKPKE
jgi:hypothetical protein